MLNPLRFQELPPWGIAPFPSLQFGLSSLPDPPWKRPLRRAKTWVLILQHARVCRSWWPHGPSVCSVYDIPLFQRGHQISSALFHGIDRIKTAFREPAWFGFSFWCRMETSPDCTAVTHMHDVCGIDNGTLDVIIVNYICSGGPRLPLFIQMVNLKNPSFLACYDFIIKSAAFGLCWNILTLQVTDGLVLLHHQMVCDRTPLSQRCKACDSQQTLWNLFLSPLFFKM